ncbi:Asp23/Gls24 family envelope stress response protein [Bacillus timonensis]|nr:Asp23/Gls24 family envelope stress response protein [Bacillus timonensis]
MLQTVLPYGSLNIADEVIAVITQLCILEMDGVTNSSFGIKDKMKNVIQQKYYKKGIMIDNNDGKLSIKIRVSIEAGCNIPEKCYKLQEFISEEVSEMTGFNVEHVHVIVDQVKIV